MWRRLHNDVDLQKIDVYVITEWWYSFQWSTLWDMSRDTIHYLNAGKRHLERGVLKSYEDGDDVDDGDDAW